MVTVDGLHGDTVVDDLFSSGGDLQTFFDQLLQGLDAAASGGGEGAEEELEWLSNKDAFPAVEEMDLEPAVIGGPRTNVMRPRRRAQEELEWLSNKDLLPTVEEMEQEPAVMGPRTRVVRRRRGAMPSIPPMAARPGQRRCGLCGTRKTPQWRRGPAGCRTLCNACGVRYESERPELHSNMHRRIVEFCAGLASGGGGEAELEWPSNEDASPAPGTMEPEPSVVGSPTKRAVRQRRTLAWPPTEAEPGQRWCQHCGKMKKPQWHEAAVEVEREWLPNKNVPAVEVMEPKPLASPALCDLGQRLCGHCGTTETPQWRGGAEGRKTLCNACGVRYRTGRLVPEYRPLRSLAFSPELHSSRHRCVAQMKKPQWREGAAVEQERENKNVQAVETMELKPSVVAPRTEGVARRAVASPALSDLGQRLCRHCGTAETPQWREGPEGRKTLCNACGVRYRAGRLVPEYRPLSSPTFSPELHSNRHSRVAQMRSARAPHLHFLPPDKRSVDSGFCRLEIYLCFGFKDLCSIYTSLAQNDLE